jgi:hypothetical protein
MKLIPNAPTRLQATLNGIRFRMHRKFSVA